MQEGISGKIANFFHQLKTNDFDDGLMIIVYSSFLFQEKKNHKLLS
jgi:hypothetical protein